MPVIQPYNLSDSSFFFLCSRKGSSDLVLNTEVCSSVLNLFKTLFLNSEPYLYHSPPLSYLLLQKDGKKDRAAVDKVFLLRILRIMRIMVPRFFCKEVWH